MNDDTLTFNSPELEQIINRQTAFEVRPFHGNPLPRANEDTSNPTPAFPWAIILNVNEQDLAITLETRKGAPLTQNSLTLIDLETQTILDTLETQGSWNANNLAKNLACFNAIAHNLNEEAKDKWTTERHVAASLRTQAHQDGRIYSTGVNAYTTLNSELPFHQVADLDTFNINDKHNATEEILVTATTIKSGILTASVSTYTFWYDINESIEPATLIIKEALHAASKKLTASDTAQTVPILPDTEGGYHVDWFTLFNNSPSFWTRRLNADGKYRLPELFNIDHDQLANVTFGTGPNGAIYPIPVTTSEPTGEPPLVVLLPDSEETRLATSLQTVADLIGKAVTKYPTTAEQLAFLDAVAFMGAPLRAIDRWDRINNTVQVEINTGSDGETYTVTIDYTALTTPPKPVDDTFRALAEGIADRLDTLQQQLSNAGKAIVFTVDDAKTIAKHMATASAVSAEALGVLVQELSITDCLVGAAQVVGDEPGESPVSIEYSFTAQAAKLYQWFVRL